MDCLRVSLCPEHLASLLTHVHVCSRLKLRLCSDAVLHSLGPSIRASLLT